MAMSHARQFSLAYLFWEIFWLAAALGCVTQAFRLSEPFWVVALIYGILCSGVAIGGLFGRSTIGFLVTLAVVAFVILGSLATAAILLGLAP
jgi:hypothetical protein